MTSPAPDPVAACCADVYGSDLVALLLGESYHPGGLALTRRLARRLGLAWDAHVLDLAAGRGSTAMLLAEEFGVRVTGLDASPANVVLARGRADAAGLSGQVGFTVGHAAQLPFTGAAFDAVVVECALCTFQDKAGAAREIARVLRAGGKLGLTDVIAQPLELPDELKTVAAQVACIAGAMPLSGYEDLLGSAGLRVVQRERHDSALFRMIDQIESRLELVKMTMHADAARLGLDLERAPALLASARAAANAGSLGYGLLVAINSPSTGDTGMG